MVFLLWSGGKKLLTPQPRLRTGFFSIIESGMLTPATINEACTSVGVAKYGKPIGLDEKIKVDLIVIGSVAVDPRTGARLGKGEVRRKSRVLLLALSFTSKWLIVICWEDFIILGLQLSLPLFSLFVKTKKQIRFSLFFTKATKNQIIPTFVEEELPVITSLQNA